MLFCLCATGVIYHFTLLINTIHTCLAVGSGVSRQAGTREGIVSVLAISAVGARVTLAFVQIYILNKKHERTTLVIDINVQLIFIYAH